MGAAVTSADCAPVHRTALHAAAFTDHVECLQLLLGHDAQVNPADASGKTPLMMAAENGQTNAVGTFEPAHRACIFTPEK